MTTAKTASQNGCMVTDNSDNELHSEERVLFPLHTVHTDFKEQAVSYSIAIVVHFFQRKATEEST
jgi:archaellum component FlaF (FlaF/FlaG flagellin family)